MLSISFMEISSLRIGMKSLIISSTLISISFLSSALFAGNYDVSVTRKGSNIYGVDGKDIIIQTRYCYEYVYSEDSILKMSGYSGEIIFLDSGDKCDVKAVYGQSDQNAGKYAVSINREEDDWYEVWGQDIFIKTSACLSLALGEEAILSLTAGGYGQMFIGDDECMVEGVYSRMSL